MICKGPVFALNQMMASFNDVFQHLPGCFLVIAPDTPTFTILGANQNYFQVSGTNASIIGRPLFEVFPNNPDSPESTGLRQLSESLQLVLQTGETQQMEIIRYDARLHNDETFSIRFWKPCLIPVPDATGKIQCIINAVEDVTDVMMLRKDLVQQDSLAQVQIRDAVLTTQQMERMEISRELHDNVNQVLNTARLYLELAKNSAANQEQLLNLGHALVEKAMNEVKKISYALTEPSEAEEDLTQKLEELLSEVVMLRDINIHKKIQMPDEAFIQSKMKVATIRILQELLSNIVKHSQARNLYFDLSFSGQHLELSVRDDGKGFDPMMAHSGLGLQNIKTRVASFDGKLEINSKPGDGCQISILFPVGRELPKDQ